MITLYHNPQTRSLRVRWLLEELALEHTLKTVEFVPPVDGKVFIQNTPTGRFPTLVDGDIVLCESGAIAQYLIERYGQGRLAPALDSPLRGRYLQWMHFPEGTLNPYINAIQRFKHGFPTMAASLSDELDIAVGYCDRALSQHPYIVGDKFTGADIMLAVSLLSINLMGLLAEKHHHIAAYCSRLQTRSALIRALQNG
ncbi:MAG: glutathione S-transferase family protein [Leptolyngbyaceae cyanobacterium]